MERERGEVVRLKIQTKLLITLLIVLFVFAIIIYYTYLSFEDLHSVADKSAYIFEEISEISQLELSLLDFHMPFHDYALSGNPAEKEKFNQAIAKVRKKFKKVEELPIFATRGPLITKEKQLLKKIKNDFNNSWRLAEKILNIPNPVGDPSVYPLMKKADNHIEKALLRLERLQEIDRQEITEGTLRAHAIHGTERTLIGAIILIALLSIGIVFIIGRNISHPISEFLKGVEYISQGNLDYRLNIRTGDEIEDLAEAFNQMVFNLQQEEQTAAEIQKRLLPSGKLRIPGIRLHALQEQAKLVGGDWYDFYRMGNNLVLLIADASGKGMPGALLATVTMSTIRAEPKTKVSMEDLLIKTNKTIKNRLGGDDFVTLFSAQLALDDLELSFINCGHEPPFFFDGATKTWSLLTCGSGLPLGISTRSFRPKKERVFLKRGDKLVLYTDGLREVKNRKGQLFTHDRILEWLNEHRSLSLDPLADDLLKQALRWGKGAIIDDITLLGIEIE